MTRARFCLMRPSTHAGHRAPERMRRESPDVSTRGRSHPRLSPSRTPSRAMATRPPASSSLRALRRSRRAFRAASPSAARRFARVAGLPPRLLLRRALSGLGTSRSLPEERSTPRRSTRTAPRRRARLDAIRERTRATSRTASAAAWTCSAAQPHPEALAYWESQNAFFFPRLLLVSTARLRPSRSIPEPRRTLPRRRRRPLRPRHQRRLLPPLRRLHRRRPETSQVRALATPTRTRARRHAGDPAR